MRLDDITTDLSTLSDEELRAKLREIRHRRNVVRPAAKKKQEKAAKKQSQTKVNKVNKLLENLTPEQRDALIKQLEAGE